MPHPTVAAAVRHPEADMVMVTLDPAIDYDEDDILVATYPWAFAPRDTTPGVVESVKIEKAQAEPGQRRRRSNARR
jgi:hypothetical protein